MFDLKNGHKIVQIKIICFGLPVKDLPHASNEASPKIMCLWAYAPLAPQFPPQINITK